MIRHNYESCGFSQRVINIINQCRYLASKKGLNLKELRKSLREDEAKQRQLIRQSEQISQMNTFHTPANLNANGSICPPWFAHMNTHGMMYSQYNVQNYGHPQTHTVPPGMMPNKPQHLQNCMHTGSCGGYKRRAGLDCCNCESGRYKRDTDSSGSSEENLMKQRQPRSMMSMMSSGDDELVNLLYTASKNDASQGGKIAPKPPSSTTPVNPLVVSDSFMETSLPVRKLASHDLASLRNAEEEGISILMTNSGFPKQDESSSRSDEDDDGNLSDDEDNSSEFQDEDGRRRQRVVSPLIKQAESAFADLQRKDSLFGNLDDFGKLMNTANQIL